MAELQSCYIIAASQYIKEQKMKNRKNTIILGLVVLIALVGITANQFLYRVETQVMPLDTTTCAVKYRILSTSPVVQVTLMNDQGGIQQYNLDYPQSKDQSWSFNMQIGAPASLSVQDLIGYGQTVTCQIFVDGKLWKTSTSHGDFIIATCTGIIGAE
jgi:hypothetical protein